MALIGFEICLDENMLSYTLSSKQIGKKNTLAHIAKDREYQKIGVLSTFPVINVTMLQQIRVEV
jgi:hypothetical protein